MTFTVTYRDKSGAKREEVIEAASRAECVAVLKARGITPLGVREGRAVRDRKGVKVTGGIKDDKDAARRPHRNSTFYILHFSFAIAAIAAIAFAWWWLATRPEAAPRQVLTKHADASTPVPRHSPKSTPRTESKVYRAATPVAVTSKVPTVSAADTVVTNETDDSEKPRRGRMFRTEAETLLAMATPEEPGMSVPPLPDFSEESLSNSAEIALNAIIEPTSNDTERTLETKLIVAEQKEEFRALHKQANWSFAEYLTALHKKHTDDASMLREAHALNDSLYGDENITDKEYAGYLRKINSELKERGIAPIDAPGDARSLEEEDSKEKTK